MYPPKPHALRSGDKPSSRPAPLLVRRPSLAPNERDNFVLRVAEHADGHVVPVADVLYALLTVTDVEHLARRSHRTVKEISDERLAARRRLLEAIEAP